MGRPRLRQAVKLNANSVLGMKTLESYSCMQWKSTGQSEHRTYMPSA